MKKFNQRFNSIIVLMVLIVLVDVTLMRTTHKNDIDFTYQKVLVVCAVIILILFIWNLICKLQSRKNKSL